MQEHVRANRRMWDAEAADYQRKHGLRLEETALAWGVWRIPEAEVGALGPIGGRDVLELGCGAAQWSAGLAARGDRPVGFDLSQAQLAHARDHVRAARVRVPLVLGDAEHLPFADASFDLAFCDHGAMGFADPARTIPEVARVLRPGGRFSFCMTTPWLFVCWDEEGQRLDYRLHSSYFDLDTANAEGYVEFQRPYGEWIRLLVAAGLAVEDLIELRPGEGATTTYEEYAEPDWARRWPAEHIWIARKS